jgi:uncharacterized protein (DUF1015 family)
MAEIRPFKAVRYNPSLSLEHHVTQPYDKISPDMRRTYCERSPHSICTLILPDENRAARRDITKYQDAALLFRDWLKNGILQCDTTPGFYPYRQRYTFQGVSYARTGFIGLCRVEEYSRHIIFPHERTLSTPLADRYSLLEVSRVHFGVIFMLYEDDGSTQSCLDACMQHPASAVLTDDFSVHNELWQLTDRDTVSTLTDCLSDKQLFIADGHHRYETSLMYARNHKDNPWAQYTLAMFVNINSQLEILPTHRTARTPDRIPTSGLTDLLGTSFDLQPHTSLDETLAVTTAAGSQVTIGCFDGHDYWTAELKNPECMRTAAPGKSPAWRELDVAVLHTLIIEQALGISPEQVAHGGYVSYHRDPADAAARVSTGEADLAFFLRPTRPAQLCAVARTGDVMPQKSTDFYPKLLTGLAMYAMDEQE